MLERPPIPLLDWFSWCSCDNPTYSEQFRDVCIGNTAVYRVSFVGSVRYPQRLPLFRDPAGCLHLEVSTPAKRFCFGA